MPSDPEHIDITPSTRILQMLGEIKFEAWQCLAELIDNSIDSFSDTQEEKNVSIQLPDLRLLAEGVAEIVVEDNGPGMNKEQLRNAVRVGYSGNNPRDKLGLFGMGFNVSTARLGQCTEVWTTTIDSVEWLGTRIDFREINKAGSFTAPLLTRQKSDEELQNDASGTRVCISELNVPLVNSLVRGRGVPSTLEKLGRIYSRAIEEGGVKVSCGDDEVSPRLHCIWGKNRSVTRGSEQIPAFIEIDESLSSRGFCDTCWVWVKNSGDACHVCGIDDNVQDRPRRIKGWLGIQRYFDKANYGIDLIRNGRVIEELNKDLFSWTNSIGQSEEEYPRDTPQWGGRIVGELEINFVSVSYKKDSFEKRGLEWEEVVKRIRGESPLQPIIADRNNLPRNSSPLGRLFSGYRKGNPAGFKNLVPGDEDGRGTNAQPAKWAELFYAGKPDYKTDEKWYERVLLAERIRAGEPPEQDEDEDTLPTLGNGESDDPETQTDETPPPPDGDSRFEYDTKLSREYKLKGLSDPSPAITVEAQRALEGLKSGQAVLFEVKKRWRKKNRAKFQYDLQHPFLEDGLETPLDCLIGSLAHYFLSTSVPSTKRVEWPFARVAREIRSTHFPETLTSLRDVTGRAKSLLSSLRQFLGEKLPESAPIDKSLIDIYELELIQRKFLDVNVDGDQKDLHRAIESGSFVQFVDNQFLASSPQKWPELIMDNHFLRATYGDLSENQKADRRAAVCGAINDVVWIIDCEGGVVNKDQDWHLRFERSLSSLRLLENWRVD